VQLFRLGWYDGAGARLLWKRRDVPAGDQSPCSAAHPGPVACRWYRTLRLPLDPSLVSGLYLIKVTDSAGRVAYYPVVVRDGRPAAVVAIVPVLTWQAYNDFGGSSLYTAEASSAGGNVRYVSFERPYSVYGGAGTFLGPGESDKPLAAVRFLERHGYDVTYLADADVATTSDGVVDRARTLVFLGHAEYWPWAMYDRVEALRDGGHHLAFLSANNAYWNVRLLPGQTLGRPRSVINCDRTTDNPAASGFADLTGRFRDAPLNRPENGLYGVMYEGLADDRTSGPLVVADSGVGPEARSFLRAAGLVDGAEVPGLVGSEGDEIVHNGRTPADLQVLFRSPTAAGQRRPQRIYYSTFFIAPSGAGVFASGTTRFPQALDPAVGSTWDPRIDRLTGAILDWMLAH
jgi:hypothetical protein